MDKSNFVKLAIGSLSEFTQKNIKRSEENIAHLKRRKEVSQIIKSPCGDYTEEQFNILINIYEAALRNERLVDEVINSQTKSYLEGGKE